MKKHLLSRKFIKNTLCVAMTALALGFGVNAAESVFSGKVTLDASQNTPGITVQLIDTATSAITDSTVTDAQGNYMLTASTGGSYYVKFVNVPGYVSASTSAVTLGSESCFVNVPEVEMISGDVNGDGKIDMIDKLYMYRVLASSDFTSATLKSRLDVDMNGSITEADLEFLNANFGKTASPVQITASDIAGMRRNNYNAYSIMWDPDYTTINTKDQDGMMESGWTYDNRGSYPKNLDNNPYPLTDISTTEGVAYVRELTKQTEGVITLKTHFSVGGTDGNGAGLMFFSENETPVYELFTKQGYIHVNQDGTLVSTGCPSPFNDTVQVYAVIDLDKKISKTYLDGKYYGQHTLASGEDIMGFKFFTGKEEYNVFMSPGSVYANVNYGINETFSFTEESGAPMGWDTYMVGGSNIRINDNKELDMFVPATASTESSPVYTLAENYFDRISGNLIFETLEYADVMADGLEIALMYGDQKAVSLYTKGKSFYLNGVEVKKDCPDNFWNILRLEADTERSRVLVKINGRARGEVDFLKTVPYLDGLKITLTSKGTSITAKFDDLTVYQEQNIPDEDYVPTPIKPNDSNGYYVGVNMCNLWQNGEHWGWDNISPYDEARTVLGYFDEDRAEMADWQIKFMVEHGIDYQAICWYGSESNAPIKKTDLNGGLNKAYFNAKYSNMMDYCILWEASNGKRPVDMDAWKNYFVPYWIEYYLSDRERYATIDNKAIIGVFGAHNVWNTLGSLEANKEAYDYLEEECRKLGYDGCIFMACSTTTNKNDQQNFVSAGYDCMYAYNYGKTGYDPATTQKSHTNQHNVGKIHILPTISVGFNRVGWGDERTPLMTTDGMTEMLQWVKNTAWGTWYKDETENWKKKMMMLSTWNEYGEGTYICPSGVNGFGYLDAIKAQMTDNNISCTDTVPTEAQKERLGYLYPEYRQILRPGLNNARKLPKTPQDTVSNTISFANDAKTGLNTTYLSTSGIKNIKYTTSEGGCINATSSNTDPMFHINYAFNAEDVAGVAIRAKLPIGNIPDLFFKTPDAPGSNEAQKIRGQTSTGGWITYYFDLSSNINYKGEITGLRFDPFTGNAGGFYVDKIEFYSPMEFELYVDGNEYVMNKIQSVTDRQNAREPSVATYTEPYIDNGNTLIPYHPDMGIGYMLKLYHVWRRDAGTLRLRGNGIDVTYTMGSSTALVNGSDVELGCTPVEEDGLPMIPIEHLVSVLGDGFSVTTTQSGGVLRYDVTTPWADFWNYESLADKYMWEFNHPGNTEGWTFANCSVMISNEGTLTATATKTNDSRNYDPVSEQIGLEIDPAKYDKILVRMKANIANNNAFQLFFKSTKGTTSYGYSEDRSVRLPVLASNNGQFVDYVFDLSQAKYGNIDPYDNQPYSDPQYKDMDKITHIRLDPINCAGSFEIDYIRLLPSDDSLTYDTDAEFEALPYGNIENRVIQNNTFSATSKYLEGSYHYDPQFYIRDLFLDANYYNTVEVTMTYNIENSDATYFNLFFTTSEMTGPDANHVSSIKITSDGNGIKKTFTFDMSNHDRWLETGFITALRVDPLEWAGSFTIESVKICHR